MTKNFGIIVSYPPEVLYGSHGIPHLIMNIIKGARNNGYFITIVAPEWSRKELETLLKENIDENYDNIRVITTERIPPILQVRQNLLRLLKSVKKGSFLSLIFQDLQNKIEKALVRSYGSHKWTHFLFAGVFTLIYSPFLGIYLVERYSKKKQERDKGSFKLELSDIYERLTDPKELSKLFYLNQRIFWELLDQENQKIVEITKTQSKIISNWLITTPFSPELVKNIRNSTVICPDVIIRDFAVGFERDDFGEMILARKDQIRNSLHYADKIICFSNYVKDDQIFASFGKFYEKISVISHGHINLSEELNIIKPFQSMNKIEKFDLTTQIINTYTRKKVADEYVANFHFSGTRFLFYSSQIRPSKNIPALIKALHQLLHHKYEPVKLVLTGNPNIKSISELVSDLGLQRDIIFLPDIPTKVMAALYHQAVLAVNPTLFEGGFPFTFSEAYSVGTPSVMSCIPVVEEYIPYPDLKKVMLFDPHNIDEMVERIYWGMHHRNELLDLQKPLYEKLKKRSLNQMAQDYVDTVNRTEKSC